ncbi:unnamed protein product [Sphacelaria rigidula]
MARSSFAPRPGLALSLPCGSRRRVSPSFAGAPRASVRYRCSSSTRTLSRLRRQPRCRRQCRPRCRPRCRLRCRARGRPCSLDPRYEDLRTAQQRIADENRPVNGPE